MLDTTEPGSPAGTDPSAPPAPVVVSAVAPAVVDGRTGVPRPARRAAALLPGLAVVVAVTVAATVLGRLVPVVGAPVLAIVVGIAVAVARPLHPRLRSGVAFAGTRVLQGSIVVLGLTLSIHQVVSTGERSLPVLAGTLVVALAAARVVGRALGTRSDITTLVGVGTAICGASAIAATDAVIGADEADVSYAVATIFTFNVAAVLVYPVIGHTLGLSQHSFGLWAGTAVNDVSSVVAATTAYGHAAASYGVVVKLTRALAIIPVCLGLSLWRARQAGAPGPGTRAGTRAGIPWRKMVPLFVLGFVVAVVADTLGLVPSGWHAGLSDASTWMITAALAAIGLSTKPGHLRRAGPAPLVLGGILWVTVGLASLGLQLVTGRR